MKKLAVIALMAACAIASANKLGVYAGGTKIGTAEFTVKLTKVGGVHAAFRMNISFMGSTSTMSMDSECDAAGKPTWEKGFLTASVNRNGKTSSERRFSSTTFAGGLAKMVSEVNGKKTTKAVSAPRGANVADISQFWFLKSKPKPGQAVSYYSFSSDSGSWGQATSKFVGKQDVATGSGKRKANLISSTHGGKKQDIWVDDAGHIVKMELGGLTIQQD